MLLCTEKLYFDATLCDKVPLFTAVLICCIHLIGIYIPPVHSTLYTNRIDGSTQDGTPRAIIIWDISAITFHNKLEYDNMKFNLLLTDNVKPNIFCTLTL